MLTYSSYWLCLVLSAKYIRPTIFWAGIVKFPIQSLADLGILARATRKSSNLRLDKIPANIWTVNRPRDVSANNACYHSTGCDYSEDHFGDAKKSRGFHRSSHPLQWAQWICHKCKKIILKVHKKYKFLCTVLLYEIRFSRVSPIEKYWTIIECE